MDPPTDAVRIADSPVRLAAWILDHDMVNYELIARVFEVTPRTLHATTSSTALPATLTNTGISSARLYRENKLGFFDVKGVSIPVAMSIFPDEIDAVPRSWAEGAYLNLVHYSKLDKGGTSPAWE